ncbi:MAG TPA: glutaredoxin 3 [Dongiaceae bacterium]|jgi:glutaredoxin 3|nr:glutaredoxin 3 [Dongiaceae bacterium]
MARVEIYTTPLCPYCYRAKKLLERLGVPFQEIDVMVECGRREEMRTRSGGRSSVPQIFIDDRHIGGCDDLYALEEQGALAPLLGQNS